LSGYSAFSDQGAFDMIGRISFSGFAPQLNEVVIERPTCPASRNRQRIRE
jgi:hypothetical protein